MRSLANKTSEFLQDSSWCSSAVCMASTLRARSPWVRARSWGDDWWSPGGSLPRPGLGHQSVVKVEVVVVVGQQWIQQYTVSGVCDWIQVWETGTSVKSISVFSGNKMEHVEVETSTGAACWRSFYQGCTEEQITVLICLWNSGVLTPSSTLCWRHNPSVQEEQMIRLLSSVNKWEIL